MPAVISMCQRWPEGLGLVSLTLIATRVTMATAKVSASPMMTGRAPKAASRPAPMSGATSLNPC